MRFIFLTLCCLAFGFSLAAQDPFSTGDKNVDSLVREGNILAMQLYARLREGEGNFVFSPYGVSTSMGIPFAGSDGSTESQMARVLRFRQPQAAVNAAFAWLNNRAYGDSPYFLNCSIWIQKGFIDPVFQTTVKKSYRGILRLVDFAARPEAVRTDMNQWIRESSQGKIVDFIQSKEITNTMRMVLVSGAYVKGKWEQTFDQRNTKQAIFFRDRYQTSTVSTMFAAGDYNYLKEEKFSVIEIPYEVKKPTMTRLSLLIFLPHDVYGLSKIEDLITGDKLQSWLSSMTKQSISLSLPSFQVSSTFSLNAVFSELFLTNPFGDGADFSQIREIGQLKLDEVLHKTAYSISEWGSEGGIAFGASVESPFSQERSIQFSVNRPFMFMLVDRELGSILLAGRVLAP